MNAVLWHGMLTLGRMFIPVEDDNGYDQYVWAIDKKEDGSVVKEKLFGVRYVPLTDAPKA